MLRLEKRVYQKRSSIFNGPFIVKQHFSKPEFATALLSLACIRHMNKSKCLSFAKMKKIRNRYLIAKIGTFLLFSSTYNYSVAYLKIIKTKYQIQRPVIQRGVIFCNSIFRLCFLLMKNSMF